MSSVLELHKSNIWFDDGNIVLQAEDTVFRVYKGVLACHSVIFKDMFDLPQPNEVQRYDGCELVVIPESSQDLEIFLKALLCPR